MNFKSLEEIVSAIISKDGEKLTEIANETEQLLNEMFRKEDEARQRLEESLQQTIVDGQNAPDVLAMIEANKEQ